VIGIPLARKASRMASSTHKRHGEAKQLNNNCVALPSANDMAASLVVIAVGATPAITAKMKAWLRPRQRPKAVKPKPRPLSRPSRPSQNGNLDSLDATRRRFHPARGTIRTLICIELLPIGTRFPVNCNSFPPNDNSFPRNDNFLPRNCNDSGGSFCDCRRSRRCGT
jgi:hypothetical protein